MDPTLIIDLGAGLVKVGSADEPSPTLVVNSVTKAKHVKTRVFVGNELDDCKDLSGLYYQLPFQKGYLLNWDLQKQVLDHCLKRYQDSRPLSDWSVIITEPCINFAPVAEAMDEILFEEFGFGSVLRVPATWLVQLRDQRLRQVPTSQHRCLVLDCGYSFSHAMAYSGGRLVKDSVRRVNVGGKVLTNYLKEVVSYRQLMVMDETHVINQCKEDACFVSLDFDADLRRAHSLAVDYVLPDYSHARRGFVRPEGRKPQPDEQALRLGVERFATPELLFRPSDVSLPEMGVAEALESTMAQLPPHELPAFSDNVVLAGGSCRFADFAERLSRDLRPALPDDFPLNVRRHGDPIEQAWLGGKALAESGDCRRLMVTRQMYREAGAAACAEKFEQCR